MARYPAMAFMIVGVLSACAGTNRWVASDGSVTNWSGTMKDMAETMTRVAPILVQPEALTTEPEKAMVLREARRLEKTAHRLDKVAFKPSADPLMKSALEDLGAEFRGAVAALEEGKWRRGTLRLLGATQQCVACHTMKEAPNSIQWTFESQKLAPAQRANFFAATRRFDDAILEYEKLLADKAWARASPERWRDAFVKMMAITVRVQNSPNLTIELLSRFFDSQSYPAAMEPTARVWLAHAKEWEKEKGGQKKDSLAKIKAMIERAEKLEAKTAEPVGLLLFLRASGRLHTLMTAEQFARHQEALYLAGRAADGLREVHLWTSPERYYTLCGQARPKSALAKACLAKLK